MHTRDAILLQATVASAAIMLTYLVFIHADIPHKPRRHRVARILTPPRKLALNLVKLMGCNAVPDVHLCVFGSDAKRVRRLVRSLGVAAYGPARANLTIFGDSSIVQRLDDEWPLSAYRFVTRSMGQMRLDANTTNNTLVIMLEDHMEPSPLHALWFMIQGCALDQPNHTAIAGGGVNAASATGLGMTAELWNQFVRWAAHAATNETHSITDAAVAYLSQLPNATIVLPAAKEGVFVRDEWQNPAYVEQHPKLVRTWDPVKEPSWGAVEMRL